MPPTIPALQHIPKQPSAEKFAESHRPPAGRHFELHTEPTRVAVWAACVSQTPPADSLCLAILLIFFMEYTLIVSQPHVQIFSLRFYQRDELKEHVVKCQDMSAQAKGSGKLIQPSKKDMLQGPPKKNWQCSNLRTHAIIVGKSRTKKQLESIQIGYSRRVLECRRHVRRNCERKIFPRKYPLPRNTVCTANQNPAEQMRTSRPGHPWTQQRSRSANEPD